MANICVYRTVNIHWVVVNDEHGWPAVYLKDLCKGAVKTNRGPVRMKTAGTEMGGGQRLDIVSLLKFLNESIGHQPYN